MKKFKKPLFLAITFIIIIFFIHGLFSYFINDTQTIRNLRPIRDLFFYPLMIITENYSDIYCQIAKLNLLDYERCIVPTGPGSIHIPEGPPLWFNYLSFIIGVALLIIYYTTIFKIIIKIIQSIKNILHDN